MRSEHTLLLVNTVVRVAIFAIEAVVLVWPPDDGAGLRAMSECDNQ
jgi:hypothetical protein